MIDPPRIERALISVSDKTGLADFAHGLARAGVEIYSTGGTARHLSEAGLKVVDVSAYTGFPEIMDGRLKTLHPKIFGGLLCRRDRDDDMESINEHGIVPFELIVVNLYPFEATVAREEVTPSEAIEQIDIGGPSLVRAAAKNHAFVGIVTSPEQYADVLGDMSSGGALTQKLRRKLARAAFERTAAYDRAIADYFARIDEGTEQGAKSATDETIFPAQIARKFQLKTVLRYGENPHQQAALYRQTSKQTGEQVSSLVNAEQLHGKELSYNNLLDLDAAWEIVRLQEAPAAAVMKHNNPCGAATADNLAVAVANALAGDPLSAFGSVLGMNRPLDVEVAELLSREGLFIEAIAAVDFEEAALEILRTKPKWRNNVRLMRMGEPDNSTAPFVLRPIHGGVLAQQPDVEADPQDQWRVVTKAQPAEQLTTDMRIGWSLMRHVRSNAIVLCRDRALVGVGAGQMSRVDAVDIAISKAAERARGAVLASDAFFPFPDSIHKAAAAGVAAVIQPGGSKKDDEVIAACDEHGLPMIFTGRRHFRH